MVAEAMTAPRRHHTKPHSIPFATRATVRSLYVVHCKSPAEIASAIGLTGLQVRTLIARQGWTKDRDALLAKRDSKENESVARQIEQVNEVIAIRSEELTVRSLDLCAEALDCKDAKQLQMASSAARNLDQVRRSARNLDRGEQGKSGPTFNMALFFGGSAPAAAIEPRNVTPGAPSLPA